MFRNENHVFFFFFPTTKALADDIQTWGLLILIAVLLHQPEIKSELYVIMFVTFEFSRVVCKTESNFHLNCHAVSDNKNWGLKILIGLISY